MAIDYAGLATVAESLISSNGRSVTVRKIDRTATDTNKPWEGVAPDASSSPTTVTATAIIFPIEARERAATPSAATERAWIAANDSGGNDLHLFDEVDDGSQKWRIVSGEVIKPGSTSIVFAIDLEALR